MNQFFYIMVLMHNQKVGFGITGNVHSRIYDYMSHSAELQSFKYLYYGDKDSVADLEKMLKESWRRKLWTVFKGNKWKLEVLDPIHNLTAEDIKEWVDKKIASTNMPIRRVKDVWVPYQGDRRVTRKFIDLNPDMYLEA